MAGRRATSGGRWLGYVLVLSLLGSGLLLWTGSQQAGGGLAGPTCGERGGAAASAWRFARWWATLAGLALQGGPVRPAAAAGGDVLIVVDIDKRQLTLYRDGRKLRTFPIAAGRPGEPSPVGEWRVRDVGLWPGGPFGARWFGLNVPWGSYGIHGTNNPGSIGTYASLGCIRMFNEHVVTLDDLVSVGTPVKIVGTTEVYYRLPLYKEGDVGQDVVLLQLALRSLGFDPGVADGSYGKSTTRAVRDAELWYGLWPDGRADATVQELAGFRVP